MTADETLDDLALHDGPDVLTKRSALAALVRACLGRHDAEFLQAGRVSETVREGALDGASDRERKATMGRPARYAEVLWREFADVEPTVVRLDGSAAEAPHTFAVTVFYGAGEGSEDAFAALLESQDVASPGLLVALRSLPYLDLGASGGTGAVEVSGPDRVAVTYAAARPQATGLARFEHQAALTVTLT